MGIYIIPVTASPTAYDDGANDAKYWSCISGDKIPRRWFMSGEALKQTDWIESAMGYFKVEDNRTDVKELARASNNDCFTYEGGVSPKKVMSFVPFVIEKNEKGEEVIKEGDEVKNPKFVSSPDVSTSLTAEK